MNMYANEAPWSRTPPADPTNALRSIGLTFEKSTKSEIQKLVAEDQRLLADYERLCSPAAIQKAREGENALHLDDKVSAEAAAIKIKELRTTIEQASVIAEKIDRQRREVLRKLFPTAAAICAALVREIDKQLRDLPNLDFAQRWGLVLSGGFWSDIQYPLERLKSMAAWDQEVFEKGNLSGEVSFSPFYLVETAGLTKQENEA
jgi:hypothetical protein